MKVCRLMLLGIFFMGQAQAALFTHRYKGYPKENADCHQVAASFGEKWAKASGAEKVTSRCEAIEDEGFTILIRYEADLAIKPVSTASVPASAIYPEGIFKTRELCESHLAEEAKHFEEASGLAPEISYCYQRWGRFGFLFEGFGSPKLSPKMNHLILPGQVLEYSPRLLMDTIYQNLKAIGVDVRFVSYRSSVSSGELSVFYYGSLKHSFFFHEVAKRRKKEECFAALKELDALLGDTHNKPLLSYCSYDNATGFYEAAVLNWDKKNLEFNQSVESFESLESCEAGKSALLEFYRNELKRPVVGGVCSLPFKQSVSFSPLVSKWFVTLLEQIR